LILSGAIGNLIDRVLLGHVIDFVQFYYTAESCLWGFYGTRGHCYWPAFNVADAAISLGAIMLIGQSLLERRTD
ncbi:MAG: signal peptidase II, partial [Pseudomonadota bacterium]